MKKTHIEQVKNKKSRYCCTKTLIEHHEDIDAPFINLAWEFLHRMKIQVFFAESSKDRFKQADLKTVRWLSKLN